MSTSKLFESGDFKRGKDHRILIFVLCLTLFVGMFPVAVFASEESKESVGWEGAIASGFSAGSGTESNPYQISNAAELAFLAKSVNEGNSYANTYFELIEDIDLQEAKWLPIGTSNTMFAGIFDGKEHLITNLSIDSSTNDIGLFGRISDLSNVSNINFSMPDISGMQNVGTVAGINYGKIANCQVEGGKITGETQVGGIVGATCNEVLDCTVIETNIEGNGNSIGGIIGCAECTANLYDFSIESCGIEASTVNGAEAVGGIVGYKNQGPSSYGHFGINIKNSQNIESRIMGTTAAGGILGKAKHYYTGDYVSIIECLNTGVVSGQSYAGGIVGWAAAGILNNGYTTIENCYNTGGIDASEKYAGGICGAMSSNIYHCYNTGSVYAAEAGAAICGATGASSLGSAYWATIEGCYYLNGVDKNATQLSKDQFKIKESFEGWNFDTVWTLENKKFPELQSAKFEKVISGDEMLIQQVRKYVSNYDANEFDNISAESGTTLEVLNKFYDTYNQVRGARAYSLLINSNIFAAHMYKDFLNDETDTNGIIARNLLDMNGIIYGEGWERITSGDPSVRKYREMLNNFIIDISSVDVITYTNNIMGVLKDIADLNENISDNKIKKIEQEIGKATDISAAQAMVCEELKGLHTVSVESSTFKKIFSDAGSVLEISGLTIDTLFEMQRLELKLEKYEEYYEFLDAIAQGGDLVPDQMKKAAIDLRKDLKAQEQRIKKEFGGELKELMGKYAIDAGMELTGIDNIAFGKVLSSISAGITITDMVLGMSDFVDGSTYVEGYGFLQDLYVKRLEEDRLSFCEEESLANAQKFYRDYTLLWNLRDQGENAFLEFIGYDGGWSGTIRQIMTTWVDYELLKEATINSKMALKSSVFSKDYDQEFSKLLGANKIITIACPVDVEIYDGEELIGEIKDNQPRKIAENRVLGLCVNGNEKIIRMPDSADYNILITARKKGRMDYFVTVHGKTDTFTQIRDIPLEEERTYLASKERQNHQVLLLEDSDSRFEGESVIVSSMDAPYRNVNAQYVSEECDVYGVGDYPMGDYAFLKAVEKTGYSFVGWFDGETKVSTNPILSVLVNDEKNYKAVTKKVDNSSSGKLPSSSEMPAVQTPTVSADEHATVALSKDGTTARITVEDGYAIADVTVNGTSRGKVDTLEGLKTGDKIIVTTMKNETVAPTDPDNEQTGIAAKIKSAEAVRIKVSSSQGKNKKGKRYIKVKWIKKGVAVTGYQVYRSEKKKSGYKKFFTTKNKYYYNTKSLKKGKRYYYKVRAYTVINGKTYYSKWSNIAYRTVKK